MKSFLKSVLANIVAIMVVCSVLFVFFICILMLGVAGGEQKSSVKDNSVLVLDFRTRVIDSPYEDEGGFFDVNKKVNNILIYDALQAVKKATKDNKIKGISIETDMINAGITQLDDLRNALADFKKSGKFVYAYGNMVSQPSYYLGSVADKYFLNPSGGIELKGMSTEIIFFKDFTEKYGIGMQVIRHGKFKAAVEPYLRNDISPENKQQMSTLLNDIWKVNSAKMALSRKMDTVQFRTVVDSLYGTIPELSLKNKLADQLIQKSEYDGMLKNQLHLKSDEKLQRISFSKYISSFSEDNQLKENQVAVLYAAGGIYNGEGYDAVYEHNFVKEIKELAEDEKVKSVVLRINSPGGSANASDAILFELQELKKKKPLVVSFGDYAASGGYYIAMAGDKIYAEPNTITGSIGVFGMIPYFRELAQKNGIRSDAVTTNANSNMYSPLNGLTPGGLRMITRSVEQTYRRFVYFVTKNRKKSFDQIDEIGGGRVWSGSRAKQIGLVDELGTLDDAINEAARRGGMKDFTVAAYPKKANKIEQLFKDMDEEEISTKILKTQLGAENFKLFERIAYPDRQSDVLMEMPYRLKF